MKQIVKLINLGRLNYRKSYDIQQKLHKQVVASVHGQQAANERHRNFIVFVEHDPVYTIGIRDKSYDREVEQKLRLLGADFVRTDRGGLITYHGPGQLTCYPIFYLGDFMKKKSIADFVCKIELTVIGALESLSRSSNLKFSTIKEHPGVWVNDNYKVAALGLRASRYVTMHGFAINCDCDLKWFDEIVPCGIEDKKVTSLSEVLGRQVTVGEVSKKVISSVEEIFNCELHELNDAEIKTIVVN